ncbi:M48 family metallopeptidase [Kitasatospora viridis]|uniref:Zn-dependent protease with chaperone function n=1 Tax=Kitasatospora viridis TaxID=281105 RepID=A0A561UGR1_9ACTN|nr:M48 family metallopeptidase [Kitasatospora viridis]TWF98550.1 Zn-dependent protease with chaperone function [Kitasatospora viridis]
MGPVRALAGLILVAGWYLTTGVLATALLWLGIVCLENLAAALDQGLAVFNLLFWVTPAALSIGVLVLGGMIRSALPLAPVREGSLPVGRAQAPALWRMVDEAAERMDARAPAQIRLTMEANAAAVERTVLMGLLGGKRILYVGAPLLIVLDTDELRAVVAHELGHDAARHTRFSALTIRVTQALDSTVKAFESDLATNRFLRTYQRLAFAPLLIFAAVYRNMVLPSRREHEFAADRAAVELVGTKAMVRALHAYHAANRAWHDFTAKILRTSLAVGVVPDDPFAAFAAIVDRPQYRKGLLAVREGPLPIERRDGPNPHPSLIERAERLCAGRPTGAPKGVEPAPERLDGALELVSLLAGTPWVRHVDFPTVGHRRSVPWAQWLSSIGEQASVGQLDRLLRAVGRLDPHGPVRRAVPAELVLRTVGSRRQQLVQHEAAVGRRLTPRSAERWLTEGTTALVQRLLVADGLAAWRVDWGAVVVADCPALAEGELGALVSGVLRSKEGEPRLRRRLGELGLDLGTVVKPTGFTTSVQRRPIERKVKAPLEARAASAVTVLAFGCSVVTLLMHSTT